MSIYTYNFSQSLSKTLGIEFLENPELSDQKLDQLTTNFLGEYRPYGGSGFGPKNAHYGCKHTDEWKENKRQSMLAEKNIMYGKTHTLQAREKISNSKLGKEPWNKGLTNVYSSATIQKMKVPKTQEHKNNLKSKMSFISPSGDMTKVFGLVEFCRSNNLTPSAMSEVYSGKRPHHKGWKKV